MISLSSLVFRFILLLTFLLLCRSSFLKIASRSPPFSLDPLDFFKFFLNLTQLVNLAFPRTCLILLLHLPLLFVHQAKMIIILRIGRILSEKMNHFLSQLRQERVTDFLCFFVGQGKDVFDVVAFRHLRTVVVALVFFIGHKLLLELFRKQWWVNFQNFLLVVRIHKIAVKLTNPIKDIIFTKILHMLPIFNQILRKGIHFLRIPFRFLLHHDRPHEGIDTDIGIGFGFLIFVEVGIEDILRD